MSILLCLRRGELLGALVSLLISVVVLSLSVFSFLAEGFVELASAKCCGAGDSYCEAGVQDGPIVAV